MCPPLSHHAGVLLPKPLDHLLIIVGGWDGRKRTPEVRCYDLHSKVRLILPIPTQLDVTFSFDETGVALSSGESSVFHHRQIQCPSWPLKPHSGCDQQRFVSSCRPPRGYNDPKKVWRAHSAAHRSSQDHDVPL